MKEINIETCEWMLECDNHHDEYFNTECDSSYQFSEGGIDFNGFIFCPYCGNKIKEIKSEA